MPIGMKQAPINKNVPITCKERRRT